MAAGALGQLGSETKGVLLAFVLLDADGVTFAALADDEREPIFDAWRSLGSLVEDERNRLLAEWRKEVASGLPSGLHRLHPSWIEDALVDEPPYLLEQLLVCVPGVLRPLVEERPGEAAPSTRALSGPHLAIASRIAFGPLAPLCEGHCGPLAANLCALTFAALIDEVTRLGARTLGRSLGRSLVGPDVAARARAMAMAMTMTGEPWASAIRETLGEVISDDDRRAAAVCVASSVDTAARSPSERLLSMGLSALRSQLLTEHPGSLSRVAGRLPAALGRRLLEW